MKFRNMLWLAIALAVIKSAPAAAELKIENLAFRMAKYGPPVEKNDYCPGETVYLSCDLTGIQTDEAGRVDAEVSMTVRSAEGKAVIPKKRVVAVQEQPLYSTGRLAVLLPVTPAPNWPTGQYTIKIEAADRATGTAAETECSFNLAPLKFGLIEARLALDSEGKILIPFHVQKGMHAFVLMTLASPSYGENNLLDITLDIVIRNEAGNVIGSQPVLDIKQNLGEPLQLIPVNVSICFNEVGALQFEFIVLDRNSRRSESIKLPITVHE